MDVLLELVLKKANNITLIILAGEISNRTDLPSLV